MESYASLEVLSKRLLKEDRVRDVIVKTLLGLRVSSSMFSNSCTSWGHKSTYDITYLPKISRHRKNLPPIFVIVRKVVDEAFMRKLILYSISLYHRYCIFPVLLIISAEGFFNEDIASTFRKKEGIHLMETDCTHWADSCFLLSGEYFIDIDEEIPLEKLVALGFCLTNTAEIFNCDNSSIDFFLDNFSFE